MRARSNTELDTRQRLVTLAICLPSQNELAFDHQRTSHVSWIKRYYFFSLGFLFFFLPYQITISLEIILLSLYLFVDIRIIIVKIKKREKKKQKRHFYYFFFKKVFYMKFSLFLSFYRSHYSFSCFLILFLDTYMRRKNLNLCNLLN
jgi:hypothetical protein